METNEKIAALSDIGLRRKNNEDAAYAIKNQYGVLLIVADGMGGHRKGEVANNEIYKMSLSGDEYREMGTTAVSCIIGDKESTILSVGDSRCYIIDNDGLLKQVSKDQTYVELLFESGKISKSEMATHPQKNLLINAVGINPDLTNIEEFVLPNDSYRAILLCSDGLYNMVSDEEIHAVMMEELTANEKAKALIKKALDAGGNDNVAVVIWEN